MPCIARAFARQSRSLRVGESVEWCAHRINKWLIWITLSAKSRRYASRLIKCYNSKILMSLRYDEVNSKLYRKKSRHTEGITTIRLLLTTIYRNTSDGF